MTTFMSLKLVVDKKKNRIVFAEADEDFVDVLCSFLTLPLGTVVRVLGKRPMIGCIDKLYRSVENLDTKYLQTEACRKMLLEPRSESEQLCKDLKLNVDDLKPRRLYRCPTFECFTKTHCLYSSISGARCPCGNDMDKPFEYVRQEVARGCNKDGVFVKGEKRFIISDDLHVTPLHCMESTLSLFQKIGINNMDAVETKTVDITRNEILMLLGRLLVSATPLTDVLLLKLHQNEGRNGIATCPPLHLTRIKSEEDSTTCTHASKLIRIKLLYDRVSKKVLSAQSGEDFVDALFGFLTFPLGCIVKLLDLNSSLGCLDNVYKSIVSSDQDYNFIKSEECKNFLLSPELYPYFGCSSQLLKIEEKCSGGAWVPGCENCWNGGIELTDSACKHNIDEVSITEVNPKLSSSGTECGGGYAKESIRFMVTDELEVTPLSSISGIDAIKQSNADIHSLVEREVILGEIEVLHLLKTCLNSSTPLSSLFCIKAQKRSVIRDYMPCSKLLLRWFLCTVIVAWLCIGVINWFSN